MDCSWLAADDPAKLEADDAAVELPPVSSESSGFAADAAEELDVPEDDDEAMLLSVWLIDIS
jgi:hypothetical protein